MAQNWYYTKDGKSKSGPLSLEQLKAHARSGKLLPTDMVKREDMPRWTQAATIDGLFDTAGSSTPPKNFSVPESPWVVTESPPSPGQPSAVFPDSNPRASQTKFNRRVVPKSGRKLSTIILVGTITGGGFIMLSCFLCCGMMGFWGQQQEKAARKQLEEADQLWTAGRKDEAVGKYKSVIDSHLTWIPASERPTAFQRVIEFEAEQGNTSYAKRLIQKAVEQNVPLSLNQPVARDLLAEVQSERAAQRVAQARQKEKEEAEAREKKQSEYAWDTPPKTEKKKSGDDSVPNDPAPQGRVTRTNYEKNKVGMSLAQVEAILGPGREQGSSAQVRIVQWDEGFQFISITFVKGRVSSKTQVGL